MNEDEQHNITDIQDCRLETDQAMQEEYSQSEEIEIDRFIKMLKDPGQNSTAAEAIKHGGDKTKIQ